MISFIIPFSTNDGNVHLPDWPETDSGHIIYNTITVIENINKKINVKKEIILVDNTHSFPDIEMPNLRIIKGLQGMKLGLVKSYAKEKNIPIDNFYNQTMWASMAFNYGLDFAKYEHVVLQHNDFFYLNDLLPSLVKRLEKDSLGYITCDMKKISISGYLQCTKNFKSLISNPTFSHEQGGYLKTKELGFADCYFFLARKDFFKDYYVDWAFGDSNHGATIKCIQNKQGYIHMGPYYDNPNFESNPTERIYRFEGTPFGVHLKGGFSENKYSYRIPKLVKNKVGHMVYVPSPYFKQVSDFMRKLSKNI